MGDLRGVREGFAELVALLFAEGCEEGVSQDVVFDAEVVEPLSVADEMEVYLWHFGDELYTVKMGKVYGKCVGCAGGRCRVSKDCRNFDSGVVG